MSPTYSKISAVLSPTTLINRPIHAAKSIFRVAFMRKSVEIAATL